VKVAVAVAVAVGVEVKVAVGDGVTVAVEVNVAVTLGVGVGVSVCEGVSVAVGVKVGVDVAVEVAVDVTVGVEVKVAVGVTVAEAATPMMLRLSKQRPEKLASFNPLVKKRTVSSATPSSNGMPASAVTPPTATLYVSVSRFASTTMCAAPLNVRIPVVTPSLR